MYRIFMIVVSEAKFWMQVYMVAVICFFAFLIPDGGPTTKWLLIAEVHAESHLGCDYMAKLTAQMRQQIEHVMLLAYFFLG